MKFFKAFFLLYLTAQTAASCTSQKLGPPFPEIPGLTKDSVFPAYITGFYSFTPLAPVYPENLTGELRITENRNKKYSALFEMNISGNLHNGSFRNRHYTGDAFYVNGILELQGRKCYEQGRRSSGERLSNLSGWTCDHLIFAFHVPEKPSTGNFSVTKVPGYERSVNTDWMRIDQMLRKPPDSPKKKAGAGL